MKIKIAPSILNADFRELQKEVDRVKKADILHVDIMDGHFVPNLSMGPMHVKALKTKMRKEAHLMIQDAVKYIPIFMEHGAKRVIAHADSRTNINKFIRMVHNRNGIAGIAINPNIPYSKFKPYLKKADFFLLMTVYPGFGGQSFIKSVLPKIRQLRKLTNADIEVDGGVNLQTAKMAVKAGATILVAGTYLFNSANPAKNIDKLRAIAKRELQIAKKVG